LGFFLEYNKKIYENQELSNFNCFVVIVCLKVKHSGREAGGGEGEEMGCGTKKI
jgi:hypothetical protein